MLAEVGVGHVSAATRTAELFAAVRPRIAIIVGVAGGVKDVTHGDVVVVTKVAILDHGKYTAGGFKPRADQYRCSPWLLSLARTGLVLGSLGQPTGSQVHIAPMVAVNGVVTAEGEMTKAIREAFGDSVALSMEDGGFLAATEGTAVEAVAVRGISDLLHDKSGAADATHQPRAAAAAAAVAVSLARAALVSEHEDPASTPQPPSSVATGSRLSGWSESDDSALTAALTRPGARVITGIPGVGKTSLIAGVAREAAAVGREVLWLDAADPVASTAALRARFPSSEVSLWNALRARLAADPTLLVLLDDASRATLPLKLPSYLAGSLVATSRERVWPPPWRTHELAPLAEDDAVRLLADTSGVALTDELRSLARFAAGLPLALVQIGLFLRSTGLAPNAYFRQLSERTAATLEQADVGPAVEAVLDQAMDRLSELSQDAVELAMVWAHLTPVPVAIATLLEIWSDGLLPLSETPPDDVLKLAALVRQVADLGLITLSDQHGHMHALTAAVLADRCREHPQRADMLFRAATVALFVGSSRTGSHADAVRLLRGVGDLLDDDSAQPWMRVLLSRASALRLFAQGELRGAAAEVERAIASHQPLLDETREGRLSREQAEVDHEQFLDVVIDLFETRGLSLCMLDNPAGLALLEQAVAHARTFQDAPRLADALSALGRGHNSLGEHEQAVGCLNDALAVYDGSLPGHLGQLQALTNLARVHLAAGRPKDAQGALRRFDEAATLIEAPPTLLSLRRDLEAEIDGDLDGQYAILTVDATVGDDDPLLDRRVRAIARTNLAVLMEARGEVASAFEMLKLGTADAFAVWGDDSPQVGLRLRHFASFLAAAGNVAEAREALDAARARLTDDDDLRRLNYVEACLLLAEGRNAEVERLLREPAHGALAPTSGLGESEQDAAEDLIRQAAESADAGGRE